MSATSHYNQATGKKLITGHYIKATPYQK